MFCSIRLLNERRKASWVRFPPGSPICIMEIEMLTYDNVTETLKKEFGFTDLHFTLGPSATPELLLEQGRDFLGKLLRGEIETEEIDLYDEDL